MAKSKDKSKETSIAPFASSWADVDKTIENFRKEMEHAFSSFPSIQLPSFPKMSQTSCDVIDEGKHLRIKMNVPGIKKDEISLNVTDNSLELSAEHKEESEEKKKNFLRKERSQVSYYRTLPLPEKVVSGRVSAKLSDGVLDIILPKATPAPEAKKKSVSVQ